MNRLRISVSGIVQGVGFRPFVYNLAGGLNIKGYIKNTSEGVVIEAEGEGLDDFLTSIRNKCPPIARIDRIEIKELPPDGCKDFIIVESLDEGSFTLVSPDISVCDDCLNELFESSDRRYLYPFINCTNCGPRYSITERVPYDRPNTTMSAFKMCPQCLSEYGNPHNRRFHAQPNACSECGPSLELRVKSSEFTPLRQLKGSVVPAKEAIKATIDVLKQGDIVAVKGLGGFHLCCDAANADAVKRLREMKRRSNKPFALMSPDVETIRQFCSVSEDEEKLLTDRRRPIVLLKKRGNRQEAIGKRLPDEIAPNNKYLGFMLPYTPLHYLLFFYPLTPHSSLLTPHFIALVMTSGNLSEEPIVISNEEAISKLSGIADAFLLHDRDIFMRVDDSVVKVRNAICVMRNELKENIFSNKEMDFNPSRITHYALRSFIRRARGYVPETIRLNDEGPDVLGCGADIKNTFAITKGDYAIISQHIGDMENYETLKFFEETLNNLKQVYRANPIAIAYDLHPNYLSTQWALNHGSRFTVHGYGIQHHYAHITSVMAERGLNDKVIGVAFDGTGYGADGNLWGGEFLVCDLNDFKRVAHFKYIPLPGGSKAVKECWRTAISYIVKSLEFRVMSYEGKGVYQDIDSELRTLNSKVVWDCLNSIGFVDRYGRNNIENILKLLNNRQFSPLSSGAGRLFDAASALSGICDENTFEGEAAIALENMVRGSQFTVHSEPYPFEILEAHNSELRTQNSPLIVDFSQMILQIICDVKSRENKSIIAARFHNTIVNAITEVVIRINKKYGINKVALSGGVFQNSYLLENTFIRLLSEGFEVYTNEKVPCNDAGISLGQAYIARERLKRNSNFKLAYSL